MTLQAAAKGRAVRRFLGSVGSAMHPSLGLVDETLRAVEEMNLGTTAPKWLSVGALIAAYFFLFRRK